MIQVFAVKEDEDIEDLEDKQPLMDGWELLSLGPEGFEIRLNFTNPITHTNGSERL